MAAAAGICAVTFGLSAPAAFASQGHGVTGVTAVTHANDHPDTSTLAGKCTVSSPGGPVWAYDNLTFRFRVASQGIDTYTVTITASGSFHSFASRFTATTCTSQNGSVRGYLDYVVHSATMPDRANLPAQEPATVSQSEMVKQLFHTTPSLRIATGSRGYSYTYTLLTGKRCTTSSTTGFTCS